MPFSCIVAIDRLGMILPVKANDNGQSYRDYNQVRKHQQWLLPTSAGKLKTSLRLRSGLGNGSDVWGTNVTAAEVTLCRHSSQQLDGLQALR